ncbi:hypothetical protein HHL28_07800 [Aerophototrophica crusticola]|uniref:DUF6468 domain-containing protein n=1 Tax=Aerophototrophica crusticola TaxID=1709002 RepID=A0A858R739_9PROT|nr:hypothetical protein HHL28_07800 [Rhodospirillaceae bacterium B3]
MIPGFVSLLLDLAVIGLLVATIVYAVRLNKQLAAVKDSRVELEELVRGFAEATAQADGSVKAMRKAAQESGEALSSMITRGRALKEDLDQIVQAADSLANRLEAASGKARQAVVPNPAPAAAPGRPAAPTPAQPRPAAAPAATGAPASEPRSKAEKELLQALENLRQ